MSDHLVSALFIALAMTTQALLVAYFAARRWRSEYADRYGWLVYAMGAPSLLVGAAALTAGMPQLAVGPVLFAAWTAFGYQVDLRRQVNWRSPPRWPILVPYVSLLWIGIFGLWMPLLDVSVAYWLLFGVLLVVHSTLNMAGHAKSGRATSA